MILHYLFVACFTAGLILGVFQMLFGVERRSRRQKGVQPQPPAGSIPYHLAHAHREISARISLPSLGGFLTFFGLVGYLLSRFTVLGPVAQVVLASIAGALGIVGVLALIRAWAVPSARREVVDERFVLMGHLASVISPIGEDTPGEIAYDVEGVRYTARAFTLTGEAVPEGCEVVIERVQDGYAYVEAWAHVEKRL